MTNRKLRELWTKVELVKLELDTVMSEELIERMSKHLKSVANELKKEVTK